MSITEDQWKAIKAALNEEYTNARSCLGTNASELYRNARENEIEDAFITGMKKKTKALYNKNTIDENLQGVIDSNLGFIFRTLYYSESSGIAFTTIKKLLDAELKTLLRTVRPVEPNKSSPYN